MDGAHCIPSPEDENCLSTAFTVTFESAKSPNNRFIKRHNRNLSLPVVKVYDNKVVPPTINGNEKNKKPGNHSEGYFSSDPEDEHGNTKMAFIKHENSPTKEEESSEEDEERSEGAPSEAGTYTIDKETPDVVTARLSIDTKFGVQPQENRDAKEWVSDWAAKTQPGPSTAPSLLPAKTKANLVSKIPSPISPRARLGSRNKKFLPTPGKPAERSRPNSPIVLTPKDEVSGDNDTERYLKTTERAMSVLAARMSLSLDSGGESDTGENRRGRPLQRSDSSASESQTSRQSGGTSTTRYNRAFSLRRGRLDETPKKVESPPVKPLTSRSTQLQPRVKPTVLTPPQNCITRTDVTRNSIRVQPNQRSPQLSTPKNDFGKKKPGPGGSGRSNSTLSSKEVEFQNWKRRKSYDPMKAAAEGKKKEAAARRSGGPPPVMSQSSTNATTTPKSPVNSVLRSASFHTTRQLSGAPASSSEEEEEEEEETTLSAEDWSHKLPNMFVENVPGGSRGSLHSNNSSAGSPRQRLRLEGVDNFIVSAIATVSNRVYTNTAVILNKLRFIFDEESEKYKELSAEIEHLEAGSEASSSPSKSTSRDLAITLKNLKRLDSAIKVLNDVLFENIEYE